MCEARVKRSWSERRESWKEGGDGGGGGRG